MKAKEIVAIYATIKEYHEKYLESKGVKLPKLLHGGQFTKDALTLVYLCRNYPNTAIVDKGELTAFIRHYYPDTNDVQQARHLAAQKGWYIASGTRKDNISIQLQPSQYKLITLENAYPGFTHERREYPEGDGFFEQLKKDYDYCCATCGSKEGEPHRYWKSTKTVLQMGHMDPTKPLVEGNVIPQCEKCNRPDRNYWIYDKKGRVIAVASEKIIDACSKEIRRKIYERLKTEFEK